MHMFVAGFSRSWAGMPRPFAMFFVSWIGLGICIAIFYKRAAYRPKKAAHPFIVIGVGVVFFAFAEWVMAGKVPLLFVLAIALITFLNIRNTQFCPRCNATIYRHGFSRPSFCSKCGGPLDG